MKVYKNEFVTESVDWSKDLLNHSTVVEGLNLIDDCYFVNIGYYNINIENIGLLPASRGLRCLVKFKSEGELIGSPQQIIRLPIEQKNIRWVVGRDTALWLLNSGVLKNRKDFYTVDNMDKDDIGTVQAHYLIPLNPIKKLKDITKDKNKIMRNYGVK